MPLHRDISPFRVRLLLYSNFFFNTALNYSLYHHLQGAPELNRFNMDDFFRTLETAGPQLTCDVKGDWVGLYK